MNEHRDAKLYEYISDVVFVHTDGTRRPALVTLLVALVAEREQAARAKALEDAARLFDAAAADRWTDATIYHTAKYPAPAAARDCERDAKELDRHAAMIRALAAPPQPERTP